MNGYCLIVSDNRRRHCFNEGLLLRLDLIPEQPQRFAIHPFTHIALPDDLSAGIDEHAVTADMIHMVVRVDDKLHRLAGDLADLSENLLCPLERKSTGSVDVDETVNDDDSVIAYDEARIAQPSRLD